MTKEKVKSKMFNPYTVLIQSIIPLIVMGSVFMFSALSIYISVPDFLSPIIIIFLILGVALGYIYPWISCLWCISNFIFCIKNKSNRKIAAISLTISSCIIIIDLLYTYLFHNGKYFIS